MISLLAMFLVLQSDDARIGQFQQRLDQVERSVDQQRSTLEQHLSRPSTTCSVEMRLISAATERLQPGSRALAQDAAVELSASTAVSTPSGDCLPAQILLRATYFDANNNFICSGSVFAAPQVSHTQLTLLSIHPWRTREFVLWKNGPPGTLPSELLCYDVNGSIVLELWQARSMRVQATALPKNGGVASVEVEVTLQAPDR